MPSLSMEAPDSPVSAADGSDVETKRKEMASLCAEFERKGKHRQRRASLTAAPVTYSEYEAQTSSINNRRASLSGAIPSLLSLEEADDMSQARKHKELISPGLLEVVPVDGYDTESESVISERSMRRRVSLSQRRNSGGLGVGPPPNLAHQSLYGPSKDYSEQDMQRKSRHISADCDENDRRPSMSKQQKRMSNGNGYGSQQPRRGSNGANFDHGNTLQTRRGSAGGRSRRGSNGIAYDQSDIANPNRRGSNGMGYEQMDMPRQSRRGSNGIAYNQSDIANPSRRGSNGMGYEQMDMQHHSRRGSNGIAYEPMDMPRRGSAGFSSNAELRKPSMGRRDSAKGDTLVCRVSNAGPRPPSPPKAANRMSRRASNASQGSERIETRRLSSSNGRPPTPPKPANRMPRRVSGQQDDSEMDYGYEEQRQTYTTPYDIVPKITINRRGSNRSASSHRSRRRNSYLIRPEQNPYTAAEIMAGPPRVTDSDLSDLDDEESVNQPPRQVSGTYGYYGENKQRNNKCELNVENSESESEHSHSTSASMASRKRSSRRNSCIIRPDQDPVAMISMLNGASRMSDRDLLTKLECEDDLNDPDSLLNRSGYFNTTLQASATNRYDHLLASEHDSEFDDPDSLLNRSGFGPKSSCKALNPLMDEPNLLASGTGLGKGGAPVNEPLMASHNDHIKEEWKRATAFTTPHTALTEAKLAQKEDRLVKSAKDDLKINSMHTVNANWGELDLDSSDDDSSESNDSDYGPAMYEHSSAIEEIDRYKQRARRRSSIDRVCINMKTYGEGKKNMPTFIPASGCSNVSDYIVRCFIARLRQGITVIKHNRSRWSKSQHRILFIRPDGKTLSWKPTEGENDKGRRPKLDLTHCKEVRHAWQKDPETRKLTGTVTLRKRCKDGQAGRSFALMFAKRTLDITALSNDQCKVLMEGFSALCFRLQLDRLEEDGTDPLNDRDNASNYMGDDDWASTIYGAESTASMTRTNTTSGIPNPMAPWGL